MADYIDNDQSGDGIDRRGFLKCMAWAGTGLLCTMSGGILTSLGLSEVAGETITSPQNPRIVAARKLRLRKERQQAGAFLVDGVRVVNEAVRSAHRKPCTRKVWPRSSTCRRAISTRRWRHVHASSYCSMASPTRATPAPWSALPLPRAPESLRSAAALSIPTVPSAFEPVPARC